MILPSQTSQPLSSTSTVDATAITSSKLLSSISSKGGATSEPTKATELLEYSVSSLASWVASSSAPAVIGGSSLASLSSTDAATPTSVASQPARSSASTGYANLPSGQGNALSNTSAATLSASAHLESSVISSSSTPTLASGSLPLASITSTTASLAASMSSVILEDTTSRTTIRPQPIPINPINGNMTRPASSIATTSARTTESISLSAPGNGTVSSSLAFATTYSAASSLSSTAMISSSFGLSGSFTQTFIVSTTSQTLSTATSSQAAQISDAPLWLSDTTTVRSTPALGISASSSVNMGLLPFPLEPPLQTAPTGWTNSSTSSATGGTPTSSPPLFTASIVISSQETGSGTLRDMFTLSPLLSTATSAILSIPTSLSGFITKTKTRTESSVLSSSISSIATETVAAAAPPSKPLTPEETAGVAIGSTAGILLAIVAAIFVARRYHAIHAAKRGSGNSSGIYPKEAYLYDPSLGGNGGSGSASHDALIFMSGGASGLPSTGSRTPPRVPKNSREYDPRSWFNIDGQNYSDPGNPFADPEDPFMDWRSSDAIASPSETGSALAAAAEKYAAGPQRPLPPVPASLTPLFGDHHIPSPTLSPIMNGCSLKRSHSVSSRRSSVRSQRSLRSFRGCPSPDSESRNVPPISPSWRRASKILASIREGHADDPLPDPIEHDLLLPVDVRSETPDSVMVYAPAPISRAPLRPNLPTILSEDETSMASLPSIAAAKSLSATQPRSTGSILFSTYKDDQYAYTPLTPNNIPSPPHSERADSEKTITQSTYFVQPSSPTPTITSVPRNKGWEEIKRTSNGSSSLMSSRPPTPPWHQFTPPRPNLTPPPPLKKRSLIQLRRKTPLAGHGQLMVPPHKTYSSPTSSPLTVKTNFIVNSNKSFEGPRMSLLAKVNSMSDMRDETASPKKHKKGIGLGIGYRDSILWRVEGVSRWCPEDVGTKF
ncbi:hypothetical protein BKA58DRAFT_326911 [Alternaria rosae]|uniref:uncharacterized protein n=1 Tax=Alternaria rosae TaxID=1187941 RepID=UPI001E8DB45C|nr:uncharacterized protein BKA58DRAFT_326911 [Alternaria rosae]KAH6845895.1 hypothetical protein BKA58DRAFT_326911 [Alternaria rosae]